MSNMSNLDIVCRDLGIAEPTMEQVKLVAAMEHINHLLKLYAGMAWRDMITGVPDLPKGVTDVELYKVYAHHRPSINNMPANPPWLPVCRPCLKDQEVPHLKLPYGYELCITPEAKCTSYAEQYAVLHPEAIESKGGVQNDDILTTSNSVERCLVNYLVEVTRLRFELVEGQREAALYALENSFTKEGCDESN